MNNPINNNKSRKCTEGDGDKFAVQGGLCIDHGAKRKQCNQKVNRHDQNWRGKFQKLVEYNIQHKSTNVSQYYTADPQLGVWVSKQRYRYNKEVLNPNRIALLNSIGFKWVADNNETKKRKAAATTMRKKAPPPHSVVVGSPPTVATNATTTTIATTITTTTTTVPPTTTTTVSPQVAASSLRNIHLTVPSSSSSANDKTSATCRKQQQHDDAWMGMFEKLAAYKKQYKNTAVPVLYDEDPKLGRWVRVQRGYCKKGVLHPNRADLLKSIDFQSDGAGNGVGKRGKNQTAEQKALRKEKKIKTAEETKEKIKTAEETKEKIRDDKKAEKEKIRVDKKAEKEKIRDDKKAETKRKRAEKNKKPGRGNYWDTLTKEQLKQAKVKSDAAPDDFEKRKKMLRGAVVTYKKTGVFSDKDYCISSPSPPVNSTDLSAFSFSKDGDTIATFPRMNGTRVLMSPPTRGSCKLYGRSWGDEQTQHSATSGQYDSVVLIGMVKADDCIKANDELKKHGITNTIVGEVLKYWHANARDSAEIREFYEKHLKYQPLGIYKSEIPGNVMIGIAHNLIPQYKRLMGKEISTDYFEVNKVEVKAPELASLLENSMGSPRIHFYPAGTGAMGAHYDSCHNTYDDIRQQKYSILFDMRTFSVFGEANNTIE